MNYTELNRKTSEGITSLQKEQLDMNMKMNSTSNIGVGGGTLPVQGVMSTSGLLDRLESTIDKLGSTICGLYEVTSIYFISSEGGASPTSDLKDVIASSPLNRRLDSNIKRLEDMLRGANSLIAIIAESK